MQSAKNHGAVLGEVIVVVAAFFVLGAVLAPVVVEGQWSRVSGQMISEENQRTIAEGVAMYAADNRDRTMTFTWREDEANSQWADLNFARSPLQAAANQAVDIMRRRGGLDPVDAPAIPNWIPHPLYNHLPLSDYLALELPDRLFVNPEDGPRNCWQDAVMSGEDWQEVCPVPQSDSPTWYRWPYSASYQFTAASYDRNQKRGGSNAIQQGTEHDRYRVGAGPYIPRRFAVDFPSDKVLLHDSHARHMGPLQVFFAYPEAEHPITFFDGSVRVVRTSDANEGFLPAAPQLDRPTVFFYRPNVDWEPPTLSGEARDLVAGRYRWTRGGWTGRDVNGPEVNTGNPGKDDDRDGLP